MAIPIRTRLTLWYTAVLALIVIAVGVFLHVRLRADLISGIDASLDAQVEQLTPVVEEGDLDDIREAGAITQLSTGRGRLLASSPSAGRRALIGVAVGNGDTMRGLTRVLDPADGHRFVARGFPNDRSLVVAAPLEPVGDATGRLTVLLAIAIPAAIAVAAAGGRLLAGRALRPIDAMTRAAGSIGSEDLGARLEVPPVADEVGRLGETLNAMLDRLQGAITEQRRFTADASHELRTPLSILRAELDVALRSDDTPPEARTTLTSAHEEVVRMSRIVEDLLTLARADEGAIAIERAPADLARIAAAAADRLRPQADAAGVALGVSGSNVDVVGDAEKLSLLTSNLVSNALKYTPSGGRVDVSVVRVDGCATLQVSDTGVGIPPEALPRVFERFYRVDAARTRTAGGAGLGLAICRWIAEAHGGTISATSGEAGSTFTVTLPV